MLMILSRCMIRGVKQMTKVWLQNVIAHHPTGITLFPPLCHLHLRILHQLDMVGHEDVSMELSDVLMLAEVCLVAVVATMTHGASQMHQNVKVTHPTAPPATTKLPPPHFHHLHHHTLHPLNEG